VILVEKTSRMGDDLFSDCILDFDIDACEVKSLFKQTNVRKSPGPDNISGRILKSCAGQLCEIFKVIFTQTQIVPKIWKHSTIIPVAKCKNTKVLNDFRPVVLTSLVMKTFEKLDR